jgi:hypothetical protein
MVQLLQMRILTPQQASEVSQVQLVIVSNQ